MSQVIYGVDTSKKIDAVMVRDALLKCFIDAHKTEIDKLAEKSPESKSKLALFKNFDVSNTIKKLFVDAGGDFKKPTKKVLLKVINLLKTKMSSVRNPKVIESHAKEIKELIDLL